MYFGGHAGAEVVGSTPGPRAFLGFAWFSLGLSLWGPTSSQNKRNLREPTEVSPVCAKLFERLSLKTIRHHHRRSGGRWRRELNNSTVAGDTG